jgi:hypothetical protein
MYSLNGSMVWPAHLLPQHDYHEQREGADISAYIVIVMMFYAAAVILMMVKYGGGGEGLRRRVDSSGEDSALLGDSEAPVTIRARLFQAIMGKNGGAARHTLDLDAHDDGETV